MSDSYQIAEASILPVVGGVRVRGRLDVRRLWALPAAVAACWPLGPFLADRWLNWDGMWLDGVLLGAALAAWGWLYGTDGRGRARCSPTWLGLGGAALLGYALAYGRVPRLLGHGIAALGGGFVLLGMLSAEQRRRSWGLVPLVMLSLPVMPSVQYVFGYPLRVMAAKAASLWLGGEIEVVGTGLSDGARTVFVDAPCSGLRMLWTAVILASASSLAMRLSRGRTCLMVALGVVVALLGNACRAAALFILEGLVGSEPSLHSAAGLVVFSLCAGSVVWAALVLRRGGLCDQQGANENGRPAARAGRLSTAIKVFFVVSCGAAALVPFLWESGGASPANDRLVFRWPGSWNGYPLVETAVDPKLRRFLQDFPGQMAEFRVGSTDQMVFLRWTPYATRKLHTAEGCYRAMGGAVRPLPAQRDEQGHTWSRFRVVRRDGTEAVVRQCYFAVPREPTARTLEGLIAGARSWPDASSWYWAAARPGSAVEATLAVTVAER